MRSLVAALLLMSAQQTTIRTTVPLVTVPVSVTDAKGEPIDGLDVSDFVLLDQGKPKPLHVDVLESGLSPVSLVVLVQTSNMSLAGIAKIKKVGSMIPLEVVGANGTAAVITYDSEVKVIQEFTTRATAISGAFDGLRAADSDAGHMLDAVDKALDMLAAQGEGHRANILIIGETKDRGSKAKLSDIVQKIQRTGTTVYCLTYSRVLTPFTMRPEAYQPTGNLLMGIVELSRLAKQNAMRALTQATGGQQFRFEIKAGLENDLMKMSKDLHNRYLISFTPDITSGTEFHSISIEVQNHPEAKVRARPGYWTIAQ